MSTVRHPDTKHENQAGAFVPRLSAEEQATRQRAILELLASWETEGDEQEQRETLALLREALGPKRVASSRSLFP